MAPSFNSEWRNKEALQQYPKSLFPLWLIKASIWQAWPWGHSHIIAQVFPIVAPDGTTRFHEAHQIYNYPESLWTPTFPIQPFTWHEINSPDHHLACLFPISNGFLYHCCYGNKTVTTVIISKEGPEIHDWSIFLNVKSTSMALFKET